jgi:hypothetical protein
MWVNLDRYQNWGLNQPDNYNGTEHYAHLRVDGTWNDLSGDSLIDGYLLEVDGVYSSITFDDKISWFDANRDAAERGGQLATINSRQDQLRAQGVANSQQLWIGATDIQNPGNWLWLERESLVVGAAVQASGGDGDILLSSSSSLSFSIATSTTTGTPANQTTLATEKIMQSCMRMEPGTTPLEVPN